MSGRRAVRRRADRRRPPARALPWWRQRCDELAEYAALQVFIAESDDPAMVDRKAGDLEELSAAATSAVEDWNDALHAGLPAVRYALAALDQWAQRPGVPDGLVTFLLGLTSDAIVGALFDTDPVLRDIAARQEAEAARYGVNEAADEDVLLEPEWTPTYRAQVAEWEAHADRLVLATISEVSPALARRRADPAFDVRRVEGRRLVIWESPDDTSVAALEARATDLKARVLAEHEAQRIGRWHPDHPAHPDRRDPSDIAAS